MIEARHFEWLLEDGCRVKIIGPHQAGTDEPERSDSSETAG